MANFYTRRVLPKMIDKICALKPTRKQREKVIPLATGDVLEIGIGSGLNLPFYDPDLVRRVVGIDPVPEMWALNTVPLKTLPFTVEYVKASASAIPADAGSFDSVVVTYTLCSIKNLTRSFAEIRRVMKPGAQFIFTEHGLSPDRQVRRWQNGVNPLWKQLTGGCNLNRDIPALLTDHGFRLNQLDTMYIPGWKPACYNFWGTAIAD
ncbi:MAG: class I SAM-dependent methyltransferase [Saprospiraceae bacterium]|nr:class I SAM-dependent methyltransferase [Saprospiraceae bacterium]